MSLRKCLRYGLYLNIQLTPVKNQISTILSSYCVMNTVHRITSDNFSVHLVLQWTAHLSKVHKFSAQSMTSGPSRWYGQCEAVAYKYLALTWSTVSKLTFYTVKPAQVTTSVAVHGFNLDDQRQHCTRFYLSHRLLLISRATVNV
jgi:hypothetical protein